jgi:putative inorganic carbon (hco3(-)) transporter
MKEPASSSHLPFAFAGTPGNFRGVVLDSGKNARTLSDSFAFIGLALFTFLLYARPNDLFPQARGTFPLVRIVGITAILFYLYARLSLARPLTAWTVELLCALIVALLGLVSLPFAYSRDAAAIILLNYLRITSVLILMINLSDTRFRLQALVLLAVFCSSVFALFAVRRFLAGDLTLHGVRIQGVVGGMFDDPNDLAAAFNLQLPIAFTVALAYRGAARAVLLACSVILAAGTIATLSRGGFLGLVAIGAVLVWKLARHWGPSVLIAAMLICTTVLVLLPTPYLSRLETLVNWHDREASLAERLDILDRGLYLATHHLVFGIGMGNFRSYTVQNKGAHNSYLEISSELGLLGLAAYLTLIANPLLTLGRLQKKERHPALLRRAGDPLPFYLSIGLQASLIAYIVCSFFLSLQYVWPLYLIAAYAVALLRLEQPASEKTSSAVFGVKRRGRIWATGFAGGVK